MTAPCTCFSAHWCDKHLKVSIVYGVLQQLEEHRKRQEALQSTSAQTMIDRDIAEILRLPFPIITVVE